MKVGVISAEWTKVGAMGRRFMEIITPPSLGGHRFGTWHCSRIRRYLRQDFDSITFRTDMDEDAQHLRLLSIFHFVVGGLFALFGCFPVLHLGFGVAAVMGALEPQRGSPPPAAIGWVFIFVAVVMMAAMWTFAAAVVIAGQKLAARTSYTYCLVVAAIECMFTPFGTVLGVLTIIVLMRPSVKKLFGYPAGGKPTPL